MFEAIATSMHFGLEADLRHSLNSVPQVTPLGRKELEDACTSNSGDDHRTSPLHSGESNWNKSIIKVSLTQKENEVNEPFWR